MKILLAHVFSKKNLGDAGICSAMISEFREVFPGVEMAISIMDKTETSEFLDVPQFQSFFYYAVYSNGNPFVQFFKIPYVLISTITWSLFYRITGLRFNLILNKKLKELLYLFNSADLIVPVGGGYLNGKKGLRNSIALVLSLHEILIPIILRKPVVLYSQSIGPFGNSFQKYISSLVLNKVDTIFVRENISRELLKRMNVTCPRIIQTTDAGFLFKSNLREEMTKELENLGVNINKLKIGITVRNWLPKADQEKFESEIATFLDYIAIKYDAQLILVAQVTTGTHKEDDREVNRRIFSKLKERHNFFLLEKEYSHFEIKSLYENLDYLIGTRMHSIIFSLTGYVPCLAIEYEYKTRGIINDLGLQDWIIKIEDVAADGLVKMFDSIVDNKERYLEILKQNLPNYIQNAKKTSIMLRKFHQDYIVNHSANLMNKI